MNTMNKYAGVLVAAGTAFLTLSCSVDPIGKDSGSAVSAAGSEKVVNTSVASAKGRLLVRLKNAGKASEMKDALMASGIKVSPLFTGITPAVTKADPDTEDLAKWYVLEFRESADLDSLAAVMARNSMVERVQFDTKLRKASDGRSYPLLSAPATKSGNFPFSDPELGRQWHYINDGDTKNVAPTAKKGADINIEDAWRLETGSSDVIVAVIDEGVQYNHPDLAANMWVNEAELSGTPGVDDDGNGYVDDVYGYNFASGKGEIGWNTDGNSGHGTHVAGTVAAVNNNGIGVCGVAGGDGSGNGVRIMTLQIFDGFSGGTASVSANAIRYAADNGAAIIQCSWGYPSGGIKSDAAYEKGYTAEADAIKYFLKKKNCKALKDGNIAIFASGNDGKSMSGYPAAYVDCISVTAIASDNLPACYTNYGPGCNIAAPGGEYYTGGVTDSSTGCVLSTMPTEKLKEYDNNDVWTGNYTATDYGYMQGTSMACPHVSGIVALGLSYALKKGKSFTRDEFTSMLLTSVNDLDALLIGSKQTLVGTSIGALELAPYSGQMGTGYIDTWKLLMQIEGTPYLLAEVGKSQRLNLDSVFGSGSENLTYTGVEFSNADYDAIGLATDPVIKAGTLLVQPTKYGSAKLTVKAIAGGSTIGGGSSIGGTEISKEISIIARGVKGGNGGWL